MDGDDLELFERSVRHATATTSGAALDAALADLGWHDALAEDPRAAVSVLFTLQGSATATSSAIDHVVAGGPVVLPPIGEWRPPGVLDGGRVRVDGLLTGDHDAALVVAGDTAWTVDVAALDVRVVEGVDPWLGLRAVRGEAEVQGGDAFDWTAAVARGQVALGHELVGASRRMLTLAREHALAREQFGQPIAQFQAIRHRLADTLVAVETAEAMLEAAWLDGTPLTAAMAKSLAGRGARTAARHCQQVLAGIGFTTEHDLHRSIRRVLVLDQLLGSSRALTRHLGDQLLTTRRLPPLLPL